MANMSKFCKGELSSEKWECHEDEWIVHVKNGSMTTVYVVPNVYDISDFTEWHDMNGESGDQVCMVDMEDCRIKIIA